MAAPWSLVVVLLFSGALSPCFADLTTDQKGADFLSLAGLYAKNYAPYEWKIQLFGFNLLDVTSWLTQVQNTQNDLDYYDLCVRYVASLNDSHDEFTLNTDFAAYMPFAVDIYDGKVLIDAINRDVIGANQYPFAIGDELVSVDGVAAPDLVQAFLPYAVNGRGNPATAQRIAAFTITSRYQSWYPYAASVGATSTIQVRDQNTNNGNAYTLPWITSGLALVTSGTIPGLSSDGADSRSLASKVHANPGRRASASPPGSQTTRSDG